MGSSDSDAVIYKHTQYYLGCLLKTIVQATQSIENPTQLQLLTAALLILLIMNTMQFDDSSFDYKDFGRTYKMTPGLQEILNEWWGPNNAEFQRFAFTPGLPLRTSAVILMAWLTRLVHTTRFVCILQLMIVRWQSTLPAGKITTSWLPAINGAGGFIAQDLSVRLVLTSLQQLIDNLIVITRYTCNADLVVSTPNTVEGLALQGNADAQMLFNSFNEVFTVYARVYSNPVVPSSSSSTLTSALPTTYIVLAKQTILNVCNTNVLVAQTMTRPFNPTVLTSLRIASTTAFAGMVGISSQLDIGFTHFSILNVVAGMITFSVFSIVSDLTLKMIGTYSTQQVYYIPQSPVQVASNASFELASQIPGIDTIGGIAEYQVIWTYRTPFNGISQVNVETLADASPNALVVYDSNANPSALTVGSSMVPMYMPPPNAPIQEFNVCLNAAIKEAQNQFIELGKTLLIIQHSPMKGIGLLGAEVANKTVSILGLQDTEAGKVLQQATTGAKDLVIKSIVLEEAAKYAPLIFGALGLAGTLLIGMFKSKKENIEQTPLHRRYSF